MKIAYISGAYVPSREANSMHVMRMCQAMSEVGHDVTLHVRPGETVQEDDFHHYGVKPCFRIVKHARPQVRVYGALANARHVARFFDQNPLPDLFYAREIYGLSFVLDRGVPFVFESHWKPKHFVQQALERRLYRSKTLCRVVFISDALRKIYAALFPWLEARKMIVAHDAADPVPTAPLGDLHPSARGAKLRVAYVGGFLPGYGIDLVFDLARRMPDVDFHVVGGKAEQIASYRERANALPNLELHGFVAPSALTGLYANFDVVLAPYQAGTAHIDWISPMKLFEYMAHAKPIVCSDFPVLREIIDDGNDGLLVRADDVGAWQRAIERLCDSTVRERLATRAREKLEARFTWRRRAERVLQCL